jgi:two-component system, response regulator PdtaR
MDCSDAEARSAWTFSVTVGTPSLREGLLLMASSTPKSVLVVEDEPLIRMVAADALADRGIMAWEAGDAGEALHVLDEHPSIGLVFTDVNMPGEMNGLGLAHEISVRRPDVSLIVPSGAVTVSDEELPDDGTFLPKPYPTERLVNIVECKLDGAS